MGIALEAGNTGTLVCTADNAETCAASGCKTASGKQLTGRLELKLDEKSKKLSVCSSDSFLPCTTYLTTSRFDGTRRDVVASGQPEDIRAGAACRKPAQRHRRRWARLNEVEGPLGQKMNAGGFGTRRPSFSGCQKPGALRNRVCGFKNR